MDLLHTFKREILKSYSGTFSTLRKALLCNKIKTFNQQHRSSIVVEFERLGQSDCWSWTKVQDLRSQLELKKGSRVIERRGEVAKSLAPKTSMSASNPYQLQIDFLTTQ